MDALNLLGIIFFTVGILFYSQFLQKYFSVKQTVKIMIYSLVVMILAGFCIFHLASASLQELIIALSFFCGIYLYCILTAFFLDLIGEKVDFSDFLL